MNANRYERVAKHIERLLRTLPEADPSDAVNLRLQVRSLMAIQRELRYVPRRQLSSLGTSARDRILAYMQVLVGEAIDGQELEVVAGISEYARRIRELRVEFGYNISSGESREDLKRNQYVLEDVEPDLEAAKKWATANQIRRRSGSAKERILALLQAYVTQPVTGEQLAYVAKVRTTGRRIRELRLEDGWRIATRFTGRPDLPGGVYVLESLEQLPPHDRRIPDEIYEAVLCRDKYACRKCGWTVKERHPASRKQFLELHHIEHHAEGGPNNPENLVTLCNVDHDEVHRLKLGPHHFFQWLSEKP